jgi:hypothetical protein
MRPIIAARGQGAQMGYAFLCPVCWHSVAIMFQRVTAPTPAAAGNNRTHVSR